MTSMELPRSRKASILMLLGNMVVGLLGLEGLGSRTLPLPRVVVAPKATSLKLSLDSVVATADQEARGLRKAIEVMTLMPLSLSVSLRRARVPDVQ